MSIITRRVVCVMLGAGLLYGTTVSAEVVINEIMQNPSVVSDSNGEWIELHNAGSNPVNIDGWTIEDNDFDVHLIDNGGTLEIPAGGYLVLSNNADQATNGGTPVNYNYGTDLFLSNSSDEVIIRDGSGTEIDRVEYDNGASFPDPNGASMSLADPSLDNSAGTNWCESPTPFGDGDLGTPGSANTCDALNLGDQFIHQVQGSGLSVTNPGTLVTVEAVVVGDYQGSDELGGFFIQEEDAHTDADAQTSEGIFVFCGACPIDVWEGNIVKVTGIQEEFFNMSQIDTTGSDGSITVNDSGNKLGLVSASAIDLPASGATNAEGTFEPVEGMLVSFVDKLTATEFFQLGRFGQVVLSEGGKQKQFTDANPPSVVGFAAHLDDISKARIILDDLNNDQNIDPVYHPQLGGFSINNFFRGGYTVTNLTGVMHWSFAGSGGTNAWRIRPQITNPVEFDADNPRTITPKNAGGSLKVATFNALNYFTTIDDGINTCGPNNSSCRGAHSEAELVRQTDKIVAALTTIDADIVGLVELENNATESLQGLVNALNDVVGAGTYAYIDTGTIGGDAIKVGLVYKAATVIPFGDFKILDSSIDADFIDTRNRPVLIQTFDELATGGRFTIAVNHLKSKGSGCDDLGDTNLNDGQGNCNLTRTLATQALVDYLATDPTGSGDPDFLIIGDLNAYAMEDPISAITSAGYTDLIEQKVGAEAYTFVFDGQWGYLDHALASASLAPQVTGVTEWHINSDEVNLLDYNDTIQDPAEASFEAKPPTNPLYSPDAYRASDHDPVIIGLSLIAVPENKDACKNDGWHNLYRDDGTPFKNQGDCIQYVITEK